MQQDERQSVPLIAVRAWSVDHVARLLADPGPPRRQDGSHRSPISVLRNALAHLEAAFRSVRVPR